MNEFDFVNRPPDDYFCPVTSELLKDSHQTLCCGNHLSQQAVTQLQQQEGVSCPICRGALTSEPDLHFNRLVRKVDIRCPHKGAGCKWVGELGNLDQHLKQTAVEGECEFVEVSCSYNCGKTLQRCLYSEHKKTCSKRPFSCKYCGHNDSYDNVTQIHYHVCQKHEVTCPNKSIGCEWIGERCRLDEHLETDGTKACLYVTLSCPNSCGICIQRRLLSEHKVECVKRPFSCGYCDYEATYVKVKNDHWPNCPKYKLQCPNQCSKTLFERQHLSQHLNERCPLQEVECEFTCSGCNTKLQRQLMQTHLNENVEIHLSMFTRHSKNRSEQQESTIQKQQQKIEGLQKAIEQQQKAIEQLEQLMTEQQKMIEQQQQQQQHIAEDQRHQIHKFVSTLTHTPVVVSDITMPNFSLAKKEKSMKWFSSPFYSYVGGYKMCLRVVPNGPNTREGAYISLYIHLMPGEYDEQLQWPFRGHITLLLLNQRREGRHYVNSLSLTFNRYNENTDQYSCGWSQYIAHRDLCYNTSTNCEYLRNDCLKFRIAKIDAQDV